MSHIHSNIRHIWSLFILSLLISFSGCSKNADESPKVLRDNTPVIYSTDTPHNIIYENDVVRIDCSNTSKGYIGLSYFGTNEKVSFQIETPNKTTYTYLVTDYNNPIIFPLTGDNGVYLFKLLESVDIEKNLYAVVFQHEEEITIENEFLPYLTSNVYTKFDEQSDCVAQGKELAVDCYCDLDVIQNIYTYVIKNITYDEEKAQNVFYGYIPEPDQTLSSGTGICFDYASLMTSMLRSQRIPTKLEVGYAGEVYHAWISCYVDEIGWIDNIIEFDGKNWSLMDPTLAANNSSKNVKKYIGDGSKYHVKYTY